MQHTRLKTITTPAQQLKSCINLIGVASSLGCPIPGCETAPQTLRQLGLAESLQSHGIAAHWHKIINSEPGSSVINSLTQLCQQLSKIIAEKLLQREFFAVIGGDHSCAIGTWSGVYQARQGKPFGLIWVDAHMDSHTPQSSHSGAFHGMPLACLLGHGEHSLTRLAQPGPAIQPDNLCLISVRSFEAEEQQLLTQLGVRVFDMQEIQQRGMAQVMQEALQIVSAASGDFGLSIDLDAIDPQLAPAVSVAEPGGLQMNDLNTLLPPLATAPGFLGLEIAEYNPSLDQQGATANLISTILLASTPTQQ